MSDKSKPMLNELQLSLNLHTELIHRTHYFEELDYGEYKQYLAMFETFKKSADKFLNDLRGIKKND